MTAPAVGKADLRLAPLETLRAIDFRAPSRDLWADEAAMWDRFTAAWAGLDDAAWRLPGAAPSDAGGPDWSLLDHVAHVVAWQELAIEYVGGVLGGGSWPSDEDYDGGDFDRFNERLRAPWADVPPAEIRARAATTREHLLSLVRRLDPVEIRSDAAWGWIHMTLHGHALDHLGITEPWADGLRARQAEGDPFGRDPRIGSGDAAADRAAFRRDEEAVFALFDEALAGLPEARWTDGEVTPGWTLRDHVGHIADWLTEGVLAVETFRRVRAWPDGPAEGIDAWNARAVATGRGRSTDEVLALYRSERARLDEAVDGLAEADVRSPEGWDWVHLCLHGHVRKHLALVGPWCARARWPG